MQPVSDSVEIKIVPTHANLRRIHMIVILNSFDYLTIPFDYLILGQNIANSYLQLKCGNHYCDSKQSFKHYQ